MPILLHEAKPVLALFCLHLNTIGWSGHVTITIRRDNWLAFKSLWLGFRIRAYCQCLGSSFRFSGSVFRIRACCSLNANKKLLTARQPWNHDNCCYRKSRAACAQSFAPWQQATIEITRRDHSIIACSCHIHNGVILHAHPVRGESHNQRNTTGEVATQPSSMHGTELLQMSWWIKQDMHSKLAMWLLEPIVFN